MVHENHTKTIKTIGKALNAHFQSKIRGICFLMMIDMNKIPNSKAMEAITYRQ